MAERDASKPGTKAGNTVFLDGQLGYDDHGRMVSRSDPLAQATQCFANVERALRSFGARQADVVRLVCYLADIGYLSSYQQARQSFLRTVRPAVTTVVVAGLAHPDALMEVEATAVIGAGAGQ
jgi:enamine deaminase RidA (YjgF/YER057c/UK114 family)